MEEHWIEEQKSLVNSFLHKYGVTQQEAAALLGLTQGNFSRKLNQGTLRVSELLKLTAKYNSSLYFTTYIVPPGATTNNTWVVDKQQALLSLENLRRIIEEVPESEIIDGEVRKK